MFRLLAINALSKVLNGEEGQERQKYSSHKRPVDCSDFKP
jgi:hypothetical protein